MPIGDEPAKINAVNTLLEQFRRGLQTDGNLYTVQGPDGREINVFAHTAPTESGLPSLFDFNSLTNEGEHKIIVQIPEYSTSVQFPAKTEATAIMADLRSKFSPLPVAVHRTWDDVDSRQSRVGLGQRGDSQGEGHAIFDGESRRLRRVLRMDAPLRTRNRKI